MNRLLSLAVLGTAFAAAPMVQAQPGGPPPRGSDRPSGSELDRLRTKVRELEAQLGRGRSDDRRSTSDRDARGPGGLGGGRGPEARGPREGRGPGPRDARPTARTDRGGPPQPGFAPRGWEGRSGRGYGSTADLERRLDRIIGELTALRRELDRGRGGSYRR